MKVISILFIALLSSGSFAQQNGGIEQANKDLEWLKQTMGYTEILQAPSFYQFIDQDKREAVYIRAKRASDIYSKFIGETFMSGEQYVELSEKLALTLHFQMKDFSHRDSLEPQYHRSIQIIEDALEHDKKMGGNRQAELYLTAANLAAPHLYFAYVPKPAAEAEELAFEYLGEAGKAFFARGDSIQAVKCWRAVGNRNLQQSLDLFNLTLSVEGSTSLEAAVDISHAYHQHYYREVPEREQLEKAARKALWIYNQQPISDHQQDIRIRLYRDIGFHQLQYEKNLDSALYYYQCAQDIEKATERKLHYTAFFLAAIHIQSKDYEKAKKQYELAQKDRNLSKTDKERSWFGIVFIHYLNGKKKLAKQLWQEKIGDREVMNGISAFYSYFNEDHQPKVKQKALELVDLVKAPNAKRIIEDGWN